MIRGVNLDLYASAYLEEPDRVRSVRVIANSVGMQLPRHQRAAAFRSRTITIQIGTQVRMRALLARPAYPGYPVPGPSSTVRLWFGCRAARVGS